MDNNIPVHTVQCKLTQNSIYTPVLYLLYNIINLESWMSIYRSNGHCKCICIAYSSANAFFTITLSWSMFHNVVFLLLLKIYKFFFKPWEWHKIERQQLLDFIRYIYIYIHTYFEMSDRKRLCLCSRVRWLIAVIDSNFLLQSWLFAFVLPTAVVRVVKSRQSKCVKKDEVTKCILIFCHCRTRKTSEFVTFFCFHREKTTDDNVGVM